jgi:hypothetical protein
MILNSPTISGSLTVTGNIITSGSITLSGSIASASYAATASFVALAQSASNAVSAATASFANAFTVAGNLTAQTLVVQTITSSVDFVTGSTRFGSLSANTHVFTGSVYITGSNFNIGGTTITDGHLMNIIGNQSSVNVGVVLNNTNATYSRIYSLQNVNNNFVLYDYTTNATRLSVNASGSMGIGTTNIGSEANLHLGAFGANEGGQLILQRGTSYTSASHLDNYQNRFRIMSGNDTGSTAERLSLNMTNGDLTVYGSLLQGPIITYGASVSPPSPYTADLRLNITHSGWGGNNDSGTVYVEYQGRAYGNNQTTTAFGVITYRLSDNGVSITSVSTAGVTLSNVTLSTDTSTNLVLRITFAVSQAVDRASIFARTTNSFVTSISADTV